MSVARIETPEYHSGFYPKVMAHFNDANRALKELNEAWDAIRAAVPHAPGADVARYLASDYGAATARELIEGRSVAAQLEFRLKRFLRNFEKVQRGC